MLPAVCISSVSTAQTQGTCSGTSMAGQAMVSSSSESFAGSKMAASHQKESILSAEEMCLASGSGLSSALGLATGPVHCYCDCNNSEIDQEIDTVLKVLSSLQHLLENNKVAPTIKVYVAAISAHHAPDDGSPLGSNNLVSTVQTRHLKPVCFMSFPVWDLPLVLKFLCAPPLGVTDRWVAFLMTVDDTCQH